MQLQNIYQKNLHYNISINQTKSEYLFFSDFVVLRQKLLSRNER